MAGKGLTLKVTGTKQLRAALKRAGEAGLRAAAGGLYQEAEQIMTVSKERYCPRDFSNLMNSGHVQPPEISGSKVTVELGYGGPAAEYALIVHEWLDPNVHWSVPGTGPKYLEKAVMEAVPGMGDRLAKVVGRAMEGR